MTEEKPLKINALSPVKVVLDRRHFACLRSVLEGLSPEVAVDRYLIVDDGAVQESAKKTVRSVREAILRQARRIGLGKEASCLARDYPQDPVSVRPTLEQFLEDNPELIDWSESEVTEHYLEAYPADEKAGARRQRLNRRQRELLDFLEPRIASKPKPEDHLSGWFPESITNLLIESEIQTVGQLVDHIARAGNHWYTRIRGLGETKADKIVAWLRQELPELFEKKEGGPSGDFLLPVSHAIENPLILAKTDLSLSPVKVPSPAPSAGNYLGLYDDESAINAWLSAKNRIKLNLDSLAPAGESRTVRAYRLEAMRYLAWLRLERSKGLSQVDISDCVDYVGFIKNPDPLWVARHTESNLRNSNQFYRPFRGGLKPTSIARAVAAVSGLHQWLAKSGYLPWNVWTAVQRLTPSPAKFAQRSLSDDEWESVETYLEGWPLSPVKLRAQAVLAVARYCGLRCSEIASLKGKSFQVLSSPKKTVDVIWVVGKGDSERYVPLSAAAAEYLNAYLQMRGIPSYRAMGAEESVFVSLPEGYIRGAFEANQTLSDKGIYRIVKGVMEKVANDSMDHDKANRLRNVSTHWLRHTFATTVSKKADIKTVQELLGHKSIQTTSLYIHKNLDEKIQAINDAFEK